MTREPFRLVYHPRAILRCEDRVLSESSRPFVFKGQGYLYTSSWPRDNADAWRIRSDIRLAYRRAKHDFELGPPIRAGSGVPGRFDEVASHNVNVLVEDGKIYLAYVGSAAPDGGVRTVGLLCGDAPEGPFEPVGQAPIGPAPAAGHDPNWRSGTVMGDPVLVKDPAGRFRLYYKAGGAGRPVAEMCVAEADRIGGPYVPSPRNPLIQATHHYESWSVFLCRGRWYCLADFPRRGDTRTDLFESQDGYIWEFCQEGALRLGDLPAAFLRDLPGERGYLVATAVELDGEGGEPVGITFSVCGAARDGSRYGWLGYADLLCTND